MVGIRKRHLPAFDFLVGLVPLPCQQDHVLPARVLHAGKNRGRTVFDRLHALLPEERRTILELKAEGLSSRDIGDRLGISERTVQRVLEELRRRMESEWEPAG